MLEVKDISLYYGAAQALRGVSLSAEPGKVTCVLGRNGVGKTSLLRAMVGQYPIAGGSIELEGNDITGLKPYERARAGIGFVPQGREIFPLLTVEENLKTGFGPLKRDDRNIPDDVFSLFPVLNSMLRRRGGDLSGGQQQQLAIGRALAIWVTEGRRVTSETIHQMSKEAMVRGRAVADRLVAERATDTRPSRWRRFKGYLPGRR